MLLLVVELENISGGLRVEDTIREGGSKGPMDLHIATLATALVWKTYNNQNKIPR